MVRPVIGITGELDAARWGYWIREAVLSPVAYARAMERAGGTPVVLPPVPPDSIPALVSSIAGLVFTGGKDIDPALYDQERHDETDLPDHRRDRFELALMRAAIEADLPFLAIGRGLHVLNLARGGSLIQHLPDELGHDGHRPDRVKFTGHEVQLSEASTIGRVYGGAATVPAAHHQGLARLGDGLLAAAWTPADQLVEAVELQGHRFGVGVQWHPEEDDDNRLMTAFAAAAQHPSQRRPGQPQSQPGQPQAGQPRPGQSQASQSQPGQSQPGQSQAGQRQRAEPVAAVPAQKPNRKPKQRARSR